jgi:hypothetical protein
MVSLSLLKSLPVSFLDHFMEEFAPNKTEKLTRFHTATGFSWKAWGTTL